MISLTEIPSYSPKVVIKPAGNRVVVLAPHPDDEVLGCGGVIRKHIEEGDDVTVLFLTDGRWGKKPYDNPEHIAQLRQAEAIAACRVLGTTQTHFFGREDGSLNADLKTVKEVLQVVMCCQPEVVYAPHPIDPHPDHRATYKIAEMVLKEMSFQGSLFLYEVWKPIEPNVIVNITDVMESKLKALSCYASQLALHDYTDMIKSLNRYRMLQMVDRSKLFSHMKQERRVREQKGYVSNWPWSYAEVFFEIKFGDELPLNGVMK